MLSHEGFIDLPEHNGRGAFDHAAVHTATGRCYVAHTANDAIDVIDLVARTYVGSIPGLPAVAGALVAESSDFVFTSNRGEDTVGIFSPTTESHVQKVGVGAKPNGLAYDPAKQRLLSANIGDPAVPGSHTVSLVDVAARKRIVDLPVAGSTRWTVYDPPAGVFHVNISNPPQIVVVDSAHAKIQRIVNVSHAGPHGLDIDVARRRLYCACDDGVFVELDSDTGAELAAEKIAGKPDVVFFDAALGRLYVAIGDPGVIEVFAVNPFRRREMVATEAGAHTLAFDASRNIVGAFLPETHRMAVYVDRK
jgi:DNA-binding beta-propeller fold protein YncE